MPGFISTYLSYIHPPFAPSQLIHIHPKSLRIRFREEMIFQVLSKFRPDRWINGPDSVKWICLNPNRGILIQILANQSLVHIQYRAHFSLNSPASICSSQYIVFFCLPIYVFIKLLFESFRQSFSRICLSKFIYLCLSMYI